MNRDRLLFSHVHETSPELLNHLLGGRLLQLGRDWRDRVYDDDLVVTSKLGDLHLLVSPVLRIHWDKLRPQPMDV